VVSIFVNPLQFGPNEDLKNYPRDIKRDSAMLSESGVDVLFVPDAADITSKEALTYVDVKGLGDKLCGASRPGHFRGVATIVAKLFNIVRPDKAYFGLKDFQQFLIIKKMVSDLNIPVSVKALPTVRERDGLARSSRNSYLNADERVRAPSIYAALCTAAEMISGGEKNPDKVRDMIKRKISVNMPSSRIDYIEVCDPETLDPVAAIKGRVLVAVAVRSGKARLIDNIIAEAKK
jgi:pantoate--beta-alanine ligase